MEPKRLSFEQSLQKLEEVVRELENSETGLDRSLELYQQGVELLNHCRATLVGAEKKIRMLSGVDADGNPISEAFDEEPTSITGDRGIEHDETRGRKQTGKDSQFDQDDSESGGLLF